MTRENTVFFMARFLLRTTGSFQAKCELGSPVSEPRVRGVISSTSLKWSWRVLGESGKPSATDRP